MTNNETPQVFGKQVEVHEPTFIAQDACLERCHHVGSLAADAALGALQHPDSQYAVVCERNRMVGCRGEVVEQGDYVSTQGSDTETHQRLRENPTLSGRHGGLGETVTSKVNRAIKNGARPVPISELNI